MLSVRKKILDLLAKNGFTNSEKGSLEHLPLDNIVSKIDLLMDAQQKALKVSEDKIEIYRKMFEEIMISYDSEYPFEDFRHFDAEELLEENSDIIKEIKYLFSDYKEAIGLKDK